MTDQKGDRVVFRSGEWIGNAMSAGDRIPPIMHVPPPLWFASAFFAGWGLQLLIPLPLTMDSPVVARASHVIGLGLLVCGGVLALSCLAMFMLARTTFIPFGKASRLITHGPYRLSRNPMYVSLFLAYVGGACLVVQPWSLILLPVPLVILGKIVIPFEEARLRETFGSAYEIYYNSVRRWI